MATSNLGMGQAYQQLSPEVIASIKQQAQETATRQGITPERALYNYAQSQGIDNAGIDAMMGFQSGATDKWAAGARAEDISNQQKIWEQNAKNVGSLPAAQPAQPTKQAENLGMGSSYKPLDTATQQSIIEQAKSKALANGTTPEQELYNYAQTQGINNSGIDTLMGFDSGATGKWLDGQNATQNQAKTTTAPNQTFQANGGGAAPVLADYQKNPYLDQMAQGITQQTNDNWNRNLAPSIRSGAMQAGGYGGSRQGVVEANALKDVNQGLSNSLTSMYAGDYNTAMGRNLSKYQSDQGFALGQANNNLGFGNLGLGYSQLDSGNQQFGATYGLKAADLANTWAGQGVTNATNMQNTPINYFNNFTGNANGIAGNGSSTSSSINGTSNPWVGAAGGAQLGYNLSK